jgi:membrane-associated phospholipid phosphatase
MRTRTTGNRRLILGAVLLGGAFLLGIGLLVRGDHVFAVDLWWNHTVSLFRSPAIRTVATALGVAGTGLEGTFVIPLIVAIAFLLVGRSWSAAYVLTAQIGTNAISPILKRLFSGGGSLHPAVLGPFGTFPSAHVLNAATLAVALIVLVPRPAVVAGGSVWVLAMAYARTYQHDHWLTDTLGGALAGSGVALLVAAAYSSSLEPECTEGRVTAAWPEGRPAAVRELTPR